MKIIIGIVLLCITLVMAYACYKMCKIHKEIDDVLNEKL